VKTYRAMRVTRAPISPPLCAQHFKETDDVLLKADDVEVEELDDPYCIMCQTAAAPDRTCGSCGKPLHPNWHAVYCSNECAIADL
jgi:hypothetical protein